VEVGNGIHKVELACQFGQAVVTNAKHFIEVSAKNNFAPVTLELLEEACQVFDEVVSYPFRVFALLLQQLSMLLCDHCAAVCLGFLAAWLVSCDEGNFVFTSAVE
jgi:hypothetical protein